VNCTRCGKPIVLVPSAKERAEKYGETPEFYTKLFTIHPECLVNKRRQQTLQLLARKRRETNDHSH
jgi:hypothetical protein